MKDSPGWISDLRGIAQLVVGAVSGVTDIVEGMHRNIAGVSPLVGAGPTGGARGISGLVYRSIRGVTLATGFGIDLALALLPSPATGSSSPRREAMLAALNGVLGDTLDAARNPLAISMCLRSEGRPLELESAALARTFNPPGDKLLILVHGLCMNDLQWKRHDHDHGAALARQLGYAPIYLHYNSGRHISANGHDFAALLEQLVRAWPVAVTELVIIGHSMGGLVARSAWHYARQAGHSWPVSLKKLVFLGTPHHGAPLERAGHWVDFLVGISPYTEPLSRLGKIRSAGIKDLRYGSILDQDWSGRSGKTRHRPRQLVPLPEGVACYAIAASEQGRPAGTGRRLAGDGLVPVKSALGQHESPGLSLPIAAAHQHVCYGHNHFDLLSSLEVYELIRHWLEAN